MNVADFLPPDPADPLRNAWIGNARTQSAVNSVRAAKLAPLSPLAFDGAMAVVAGWQAARCAAARTATSVRPDGSPAAASYRAFGRDITSVDGMGEGEFPTAGLHNPTAREVVADWQAGINRGIVLSRTATHFGCGWATDPTGLVYVVGAFGRLMPVPGDDFRSLVISEADRLRTLAGSPAVAWDGQLEGAATRHRDDLARRRTMDHYGFDGSSPWDRIRASGFPVSGDGYLETGSEGLGLGYGPHQPPLDVFARETNYRYVPGIRAHATDLLNPRYNRIAAAGPRDGFLIWVVVYGHLPGAASPPGVLAAPRLPEWPVPLADPLAEPPEGGRVQVLRDLGSTGPAPA